MGEHESADDGHRHARWGDAARDVEAQVRERDEETQRRREVVLAKVVIVIGGEVELRE